MILLILITLASGQGCHPQCVCGTTTIPAVCTPICRQPNCTFQCDDPCGKPNCHDVCPNDMCESEQCPACEIQCEQTNACFHCDIVCEAPSCFWSCSKPQPNCVCEHPVCEFSVGGVLVPSLILLILLNLL